MTHSKVILWSNVDTLEGVKGFMNILVVSDNYPSKSYPTRGAFVYNLVQEFCRRGAEVRTIVPEGFWSVKGSRQESYGPELSEVRRPKYLPVPHRTLRPGITTANLGLYSFHRATQTAVSDLPYSPDVVYAHFLYPGGAVALSLAKRFNCPSVVALGESRIERWEATYGFKAVQRNLHRFSKIIAVSEVIRDYCVHRMGVNPAKVAVIPNAVDTQVFYPRERLQCRKKLDIPLEDFVIVFVGHFDERKGFARLLTAIESYPNVKAVFIGDGPKYPTGKQVLFAGPVKHSEVPEWLGAAELFVLPTLAEGACNALNEALAVGLPVVVSDIPALREQVDERAAVFVDPRNTDEIGQVIHELSKNTERRAEMSARALDISADRTLSGRATRILRLLDEVAAR